MTAVEIFFGVIFCLGAFFFMYMSSHIKEEHLNEIIEKKKYTKEYPKLVKQLVHLLYKNKSNRNFILHNKKYFILTEPGKLEQISLNDLNTKIIYNTFDKINMCFDINYTDILAERTGYELYLFL